jgi:hypothetical protein
LVKGREVLAAFDRKNRIVGGKKPKDAKFTHVSTRHVAMFGFLKRECGIYRIFGINLELVWHPLDFWHGNEGGVSLSNAIPHP